LAVGPVADRMELLISIRISERARDAYRALVPGVRHEQARLVRTVGEA
jgi:hypothetical protein